MNIKPVNDRILIKQIEEENNFKNIIIPKNNSDKPDKGLILALSEKSKFLKNDFKIGDKILFNKYSGQILKFNKEEFILIKEEDVLAILE